MLCPRTHKSNVCKRSQMLSNPWRKLGKDSEDMSRNMWEITINIRLKGKRNRYTYQWHTLNNNLVFCNHMQSLCMWLACFGCIPYVFNSQGSGWTTKDDTKHYSISCTVQNILVTLKASMQWNTHKGHYIARYTSFSYLSLFSQMI